MLIYGTLMYFVGVAVGYFLLQPKVIITITPDEIVTGKTEK